MVAPGHIPQKEKREALQMHSAPSCRSCFLLVADIWLQTLETRIPSQPNTNGVLDTNTWCRGAIHGVPKRVTIEELHDNI
jgi:hypothetical protein